MGNETGRAKVTMTRAEYIATFLPQIPLQRICNNLKVDRIDGLMFRDRTTAIECDQFGDVYSISHMAEPGSGVVAPKPTPANTPEPEDTPSLLEQGINRVSEKFFPDDPVEEGQDEEVPELTMGDNEDA